MANSQASATTPKLIMAGCICVVVAALYFAQEVLIPLALATLLSFLLAPLVKRLEHLKLPRVLAVIVTVLVAFGALFCIGWVVYSQVGDLRADMGTYHDRIVAKIASIQKGGLLHWVHSAGEEVNQVLHSSTTQPTRTEQTTEVSPIGYGSPGSGSPLDLLKPIYSFLLGPLGTAFIVTVFAIFMLLQREDLRDRLIRLLGRNRLTLTTQALDDAAARVSRYLLMQSLVNSSVGVIIFVLLWGVGRINHGSFPAVALWGLMATLLRFIPYIGIWISALTPILIALAVFPGAKAAVETLFCYGGVEILTANAIEPMLFGSSTGIATLAVLVAAAFWTWLWGPVGLLLSTPLTVCLVVMGKYVPQLEFLTILLAEEPALSPPDRVYQRLLATDQEEAEDLVEEYGKKMPLEELYDTVLIPALATAEVDAHRGRLDEDHLAAIQKGVRDILAGLRDQQKARDARDSGQPNPGPDARTMLPRGCSANVICLPANAESDEIAGMMLAHLLEMRGYCVKVASVAHLASEMLQTVRDFKADIVCISALPPVAVTHARYLCKRIHGQLPDVQMVVGLWANQGDPKRAMDRISTVRPVRMANTLVKAIEEIHQLAQQPKILGGAETELPSNTG
jgi:predicted PurR-regulated permease PerM